MHVDSEYVRETLAALVRINSINPAFGAGDTDERAIVAYIAELLEALGLEISIYLAEPDRPSVVGRLRGSGGGPSLMLYGHLDTVGVEDMQQPFEPLVRDGRMFGRGTYDMKGGFAACLTAVKALRDSRTELLGDVLVVGVADEEVASIGMSEILRHERADAAVVTEPTELAVCLAHKGFAWIEVAVEGRAAHGSRFDEGIDANMRMGRVLARLEELERELRARPPHPLVGPPSLHVGVLQGGTGQSIYAARSRLELERRTLPSETEEEVLAEVQRIVSRLAADDPTFQATVRATLVRGAFEVAAGQPIVKAVRDAASDVLGAAPPIIGQPFWMDAALLAAAGIPTAVIGPAGEGAHAAEEWVDLRSVEQLAEILARTALSFCQRVESAA